MAVHPLSDLARACGAHLAGSNSRISHLLTDSRQLSSPEGTLFFALKTARNDGHKYIADLWEKGVRNFCVLEIPKGWEEKANWLVATDTLLALQDIGTYNRGLYTGELIGITGSNGKTIVKEWLWQLMHSDRNITRSPGSYNSQTGVPLSLWLLNGTTELGIFEAGISKPGEMGSLARMMQPTVGIFTHIGHAHDQYFTSLRQKIEEKVQLFESCHTLIYCPDQAEVRQVLSTRYPEKNHFTWGEDPDATVQILHVNSIENRSAIRARFAGSELNVEIPFADSASVENAMHCLSALLFSGYSPEAAAKRMAGLHGVEMRLELKEAINNSLIINDAYSSDIDSLRIALDFMNNQMQDKKGMAILSDIQQSGLSDDELYKEVADLVSSRHVSQVTGIGPTISKFRYLFPEGSVFYPDTEAFLNSFDSTAYSNHLILLKGARSFRFELIDELLQQKSHETVLEVNLSALVNNLNQIRSHLHNGTRLMAMVKAFSYGSGSVEIANILQYHHVDYLGVAFADEGVELRKAGIYLPIVVMNPEFAGMEAIIRHRLEPEIYSFRVLDELEKALQLYAPTGADLIRIHVKLDTGMHRLGFLPSEVPALAERLRNHPHIRIASAFSHFAASDDPAFDGFTRQQLTVFSDMTQQLEQLCGYPFIRHIANSAAIIRFPEAHFDMVRLGISLYGISSQPELKAALIPVSTLSTTISQIKHLKKGETVGYNRAWELTENATIAVIPIGYADGLHRVLGNGKGNVLVHGKQVPIVGNISMDMATIDVTGLVVNEGDRVIIFGESLPIEDLADAMNTIPYEVLTSISRRVKRVYIQE